MSPATVTSLVLRLSERDIKILESVRTYRLLSTALIRRLHFAEGHATPTAAAGATMRVLTRLESLGLVVRLPRRIGGVRAGSSGICWQLGATGENLLRKMHGEQRRSRYQPPSAAFMAHTLAVADLSIRMHELARTGAIELLGVTTEPKCWHSFIGPHGVAEWLKPDLYGVTASGDYEDHWYLEADLATEHPPVVVRKAKVYQRYRATNAQQTRHGVFPAVVWVVPNSARQRALQTAFSTDATIQPNLFRIITTDQVMPLITAGHPGPGDTTASDSKAHKPKGGTAHA